MNTNTNTPDGYALVPLKPSMDMIRAGGQAAREYLERTGGNSPAEIYRAMIAAAPATAAPAAPQDERAAKKLYLAYIDNDPQIHSNRFPCWEELGVEAKRPYLERAALPAQAVAPAQILTPDEARAAAFEARNMSGPSGTTSPAAYVMAGARAAVAKAAPVQAVAPTDALGWFVRERRNADGSLQDCFVQAPAVDGMAYGLEVLGDDYTGYGDVEGKHKHCQMIVAWANAAQPAAQPADAQQAVTYVIRRAQRDARLASLIGPGTQCWDVLTESAALAAGREVDEYRAAIEKTLRYERWPGAGDIEDRINEAVEAARIEWEASRG